MTRDEIRMKLWCDAWLSEWNSDSSVEDCDDTAEFVLNKFDERFPAESEPADEYEGRVGTTVLKTILEWCEGNIESGSQVAPFCVQVRDLVEGALTYPGCKRAWNDPADEPRRVWMVYCDYGYENYTQHTEADAQADLNRYRYVNAYAEFTQSGPMVRRDGDE